MKVIKEHHPTLSLVTSLHLRARRNKLKCITFQYSEHFPWQRGQMRNISLLCPQKAGRRSLENRKASRWIQKYIEFEKSKEREKLKKYNSTDLIKQHLCGFEMIKSL